MMKINDMIQRAKSEGYSDDGMKENNIEDVRRRVFSTFRNQTYLNRLKSSRKNWLGVELKAVLDGIMNYLNML